jgi:urease accessory protein
VSAAAGLLAAVWQADTAFPSGAFAFSNGLEGAVALGTEDGREGFAALVEMHLRHRWRSADRVALVHAFRAAGDVGRLAEIDAAVEAATMVEALRTGSRRQGAALVAAHARIGTEGAADLQAAMRAGQMLGHLAIMQGALWRVVGLSEEAAVTVSAYTAVQGLATASVRLGRIGIVEAQAVVAASFATITPLAALPVADDEPIASFASLLDVAAARHAGAEVRLFSN